MRGGKQIILWMVVKLNVVVFGVEGVSGITKPYLVGRYQDGYSLQLFPFQNINSKLRPDHDLKGKGEFLDKIAMDNQHSNEISKARIEEAEKTIRKEIERQSKEDQEIKNLQIQESRLWSDGKYSEARDLNKQIRKRQDKLDADAKKLQADQEAVLELKFALQGRELINQEIKKDAADIIARAKSLPEPSVPQAVLTTGATKVGANGWDFSNPQKHGFKKIIPTGDGYYIGEKSDGSKVKLFNTIGRDGTKFAAESSNLNYTHTDGSAQNLRGLTLYDSNGKPFEYISGGLVNDGSWQHAFASSDNSKMVWHNGVNAGGKASFTSYNPQQHNGFNDFGSGFSRYFTYDFAMRTSSGIQVPGESYGYVFDPVSRTDYSAIGNKFNINGKDLPFLLSFTTKDGNYRAPGGRRFVQDSSGVLPGQIANTSDMCIHKDFKNTRGCKN